MGISIVNLSVPRTQTSGSSVDERPPNTEGCHAVGYVHDTNELDQSVWPSRRHFSLGVGSELLPVEANRPQRAREPSYWEQVLAKEENCFRV